MAIQLQFRRGTAAEWSSVNPTLAEGEMGIELDTDLFKIGNGIDAWNDLDYGGLRGFAGSSGYVGSQGNTEAENVLYVAKNGDDANNGRSLTYPKKTVKAAVDASEYGTTVFVKSGDYTENNPILVPEGVSIVGDSLRTVTIRPLNKDQDLFWVNNGVYLTQMTFKDHESPAAAVAFPTDGSAGIIHTSPYVQNCTSMTSTGTGLRIDGSDVEGLKSFVVDAFTQYNQGGIGIHHLNRGNSQLVSVFTICCDVAVLAESGGFCSLTNSNSSFGNFGLKADGVSPALYSGTIIGDSTAGDSFTIRNLTQKPNIGDAVKFDGDPNYYTLSTSTPLSSGNTEIAYQDFTTESAAKINARNSILDRKSKIQTDTIDFLNEKYTRFVYDQVKCSRDADILKTSSAYDIALGTNYNAVRDGISYRRGMTARVIDEQKEQTIDAINYEASIVGALLSDSTAISRNTVYWNEVVDIIDNGVGAADALTFTDTGVALKTTARTELQTNRASIIADLTNWISTTYPLLVYDEATCERDTGYIVDALSYDIQYGGNSASVEAARAYYSGTLSVLPIGEQAPTAAAFTQLKTVVNSYISGLYEQVEAGELIDIIINIISFGTAALPEKVYPEITWASSAIQTDANAILDDDTIASSVIDYINTNYVDFSFNQFKCTRDVGYILEAVADDMVFGTNYKTVLAAKSYYLGTFNSATFNEQKTQYIAGLNFVKDETLRYLSEDSTQTAEYNAVSDRFDTLIDIFTNGLTSVPAIDYVAPTGAPAAQAFAKDLLQLNRQFLIEEGIAYLDQNYMSTYDEAKCRRDSGLILDAVSYDIALGTNFNSVYAGLAYQRANAAYVTSSQLTYTVNAVANLKTEVAALTDVDADLTALARSNAGFDEIIDILENGSSNADSLTFPHPTGVNQYQIDIKDQLQGNREFLQAEVIAWITSNYPNLTYDQTKCSRDVGYIVDSICYDILYGGNIAIRQAADSYFVGAVSQLGAGEAVATSDAYDFLSTTAQTVVQNTTIQSPQQATVPQYTTSGSSVGSSDALQIDSLIQVIRSVISAGNTNSLPTAQYPNITWTDQALQDAHADIQANRSTLIDDTITFIDNSLFLLTYDQTKCRRDIGIIVDAVTYDILYGGNSQTADAADEYYASGTLQVPTNEKSPTIAAFDYIKSVAADCLLNIAVTNLNTVESQVIGTYPSTQEYVDRSNDLFNIVTNLIEYAYTSVITIDETKLAPFADDTAVTFHQFSLITASGHTFEWVGAGTNINTALPYLGGEPDTAAQVIIVNQGKVYYTGTDQRGDFRIGSDLTINRNTGTITGRTFSKSLFAVLTPYILAIGE